MMAPSCAKHFNILLSPTQREVLRPALDECSAPNMVFRGTAPFGHPLLDTSESAFETVDTATLEVGRVCPLLSSYALPMILIDC